MAKQVQAAGLGSQLQPQQYAPGVRRASCAGMRRVSQGPCSSASCGGQGGTAQTIATDSSVRYDRSVEATPSRMVDFLSVTIRACAAWEQPSQAAAPACSMSAWQAPWKTCSQSHWCCLSTRNKQQTYTDATARRSVTPHHFRCSRKPTLSYWAPVHNAHARVRVKQADVCARLCHVCGLGCQRQFV